MLSHAFIRMLKEVQFQTPLRRYFFPRYGFNFTPPQLCYLCRCLEETRRCEGSIAEIGCSIGSTTVFLNKYMDATGLEKTYFALDTFSGFVAADIEHEVAVRGKAADMFTGFRVNKKKWFDATMNSNYISRVKSIETDVNMYDLSLLGQLAFALIDIDLYRPIRKVLPQMYNQLSPGGVIIVDDCDLQISRFDGAGHAYKEFAALIGQPVRIVHRKLGVLKKSNHSANGSEVL
jgi:O-methyltransferase